MATSSSGGYCKYDVFLSFRGEDTRKIFVGHLYRALQHKAINAFIDSEELSKGNKISELLTAIQDSRLSIVVLSENYASSTWCLKELVKILDCMDTMKQLVVPVFYELDPSVVRKISGTFAQAFSKHEGNSDLDKEELERWRSALTRVADLSGWDSHHYEDDGKLIEEIVETTLKELIYRSYHKANGLVGMDSHITEMNARLCLEVNDVRVVGIWGMGGLGKTTIARVVYDEIACQFEYSCFLNNVKEAFINKHDVQMQEELLSRLLKEKVQSIDFHRGRNMILERLGTRKVLVVLDDVETFSQIEALLGELRVFGKGSRIIITTRNKQSLSGVDYTYEPRYLSGGEALDLFTKYAFRTNQPSEGYDHLSRCATEYACGLPLALKVLGSFLDNKSIYEWKAVLEKLKKIPHIEIHHVLRMSFDGLDDLEKDIFLDIACLFRYWETDYVTELLESCGFFPRNGLRVLIDKALITASSITGDTSDDEEFDMHDLLQEMGREIVRLESTKEPGKRSRLWSYEDANRVLTQNTATDAVECLKLDLSNSKVDLCINSGAFVGMTKLRILMIFYSFNSAHDEYLSSRRENFCPVDGCRQLTRGDLEFLSDELRVLLWHGCPLKSLPSAFMPKNLVRLDMRGSHIRELWEGIKPLQNLKVMMLSHCQFLVNIPDLTDAICLEKLYLNGCSSLFELHSSISALQNLQILDLQGCKKLKTLPRTIHMKSLWSLHLWGCSNLEMFPEISQVMNELRHISLDGTAIKELPSSINNLTGLTTLDLRGCREFMSLPSSIDMKSLRTLRVSGCLNVVKFPEISEDMIKLSYLDLDGTAIKELPSSINNLTGLVELKLEGCTKLMSLPTSIHLSSLRTLNLKGCSSLENFPEISGIMKELSNLLLDGTAIKRLPSSIDRLEGLTKLSMRFCRSLEFLPDNICHLVELTHLDLSGCSALHYLPENMGDLKSLNGFHLKDCGIKQLPFSILRLGDRISCIRCKEMEAPLSAWPSSVKEYCSYAVLLHLDLRDCNVLELSDGIAHFSSLKSLNLSRNNLESLPATMNQLCCLTHLVVEGCERLKSIPELSASISYIDAYNCTALEAVSKPKPQYQTKYFLTFSNCHQLVQTNLFRDIVETHSHLQDNHLPLLRLKMSLPGSEVPDWFTIRSRGVSVSVHLPADWFLGFMGFTICAVGKQYQEVLQYASPLSAACLCTLKGNSDECCFSFDMLDSVFRFDRFLQSDHMFLRYVSWAECHLIAKGKLVNGTYTEAIFQMVVTSESKTEQLGIRSCGVDFLYADPDKLPNPNMPQPNVHVDSRGTKDYFMDSHEMRKRQRSRRRQSF